MLGERVFPHPERPKPFKSEKFARRPSTEANRSSATASEERKTEREVRSFSKVYIFKGMIMWRKEYFSLSAGTPRTMTGDRFVSKSMLT